MQHGPNMTHAKRLENKIPLSPVHCHEFFQKLSIALTWPKMHPSTDRPKKLRQGFIAPNEYNMNSSPFITHYNHSNVESWARNYCQRAGGLVMFGARIPIRLPVLQSDLVTMESQKAQLTSEKASPATGALSMLWADRRILQVYESYPKRAIRAMTREST